MLRPILLICLSAVCSTLARAAEPAALERVWESEASLPVPESVRFDPARGQLYVSNIDGEPWAADGKGSIARLDLEGRILEAAWITGLDCPKGMALEGDRLYVADAPGLRVIDVNQGRVLETITLEGAVGLNDVVGDGAGTIYVSDMKAGKVYAVKQGRGTVLHGGLKNPNGLAFHEGALYVLDDDALHRRQPDGSLLRLAGEMTGGVDGVEAIGGGEFLVSAWAGALWRVHADGSKTLLFDGKAQGVNTADIGWNASTRTAYVPTFFGNTVVAFRLP